MQQHKPMQWVKADPSHFTAGGGNLPTPRSGHTAVCIGKSKVVVFGGFADKRFLDSISVYDVENKLWYTPDCTGTGSEGQAGPSPRAFHVAIAIDCNMFIFGGRLGGKRLGDFWMLDTDIWQWSELTSFGDIPSPREFAAASAIGNRKIVMHGGWDGKKWLSDVYIMDTMSLEWRELSISGSVPTPRCGHSATMIERRLLIFGGRGGSGPILGDLWALKGLNEEDNETPGWTQLKLPGQAPSARCGHTVTSGGHYLLLFGGHGTGGWLSRHDVYYNDCIILDRVTVQWKRFQTGNEAPPPRAYHSLTSVGSNFLLFGGFDGKTTFGDMWWLVPEDDPLAKSGQVIPSVSPESQLIHESDSSESMSKETQSDEYPIEELAKRLGISLSLKASDDGNELIYSSTRFSELRDCWRNSSATSLKLQELGPLLRDYQSLIFHHHLENPVIDSSSSLGILPETVVHRFFHLKSASQLRMDDIPILLDEYKRLLSS